jgi:hypothetical protein
MKTFAIGASLVAVGAAGEPDFHGMWQKFKSDFKKEYDHEKERFEIFRENVRKIEEHNAKKLSYELGLNEFADMTSDEFFSTRLGFKPSKGLRNSPETAFPNITDVPDSIDWNEKGAVTAVKNQKGCGSCWAFSSTGALEGGLFVHSGKLVSLSEEDLVQCDKEAQGCNGGGMSQAFDWVKTHGVCGETAYPYTSGGGVTGKCKKGCTPVAITAGHVEVPAEDEDALKKAVSLQPVSVGIEADKSVFQLYKRGIVDSKECGTNLDHGVLVVGYGTDSGKDYWLVKNSWGAAWGEKGFVRLVRGKNMCGISMMASYPKGVKAYDGPAPTPGPSPPSPPAPSSESHYEDPKDGCQSDEISLQIQGVDGAICSPKCGLFTKCPSDLPAGVTAAPQCALQNAATHSKYCALICSPDSNDQCGPNASCKSIQSVGICTYDDDGKASDILETVFSSDSTKEIVV